MPTRSDFRDRLIDGVLFDFGGVLAEEGFREGLMAIARKGSTDPDIFFNTAAETAYETGYVRGEAEEADYWRALRETTGIVGSDEEFREEILSRFVLRPWMIDIVRAVRSQVLTVAILSDQSNWLDELNEKYDFFNEFEAVFNSYALGKGKRDPSLFADVSASLGIAPPRLLFIDDSEDHIARARSKGLKAILFRGREDLLIELSRYGLIVS